MISESLSDRTAHIIVRAMPVLSAPTFIYRQRGKLYRSPLSSLQESEIEGFERLNARKSGVDWTAKRARYSSKRCRTFRVRSYVEAAALRRL
jgi:hypothetical protein